MAQTDSELISEVRAYTDYDIGIIDDATMQELVDIGKEELRSHFGNSALTFYTADTLDHTRTLFWFVIIATKVHTGELAGVNLTVGSFRATSYSENKFGNLFRNFHLRLRSAESHTVSLTNVDRDNRTYGQ